MAVYNLASKYAGKMEKQWLHDSFVKPHTNGELEFNGVDTVQVSPRAGRSRPQHSRSSSPSLCR